MTSGHRPAAITLVDVEKRFGDTVALAGVSAQVAAGCLTGLVGPDGAGKTTLLRLAAALLTPTRGRIEVQGLDTAGPTAAIHAITGYMPQRFGLYEDLSVLENLRLHARLRGLRGGEAAATFERLLDFTRLAPFTARLAGRLSGGMKQKLGLACALMARPQVLLLDEPSVGVDPTSRRELWAMVQSLRDEGMAVVWSTAYLDEAERCDTVLLLDQGRVAFDGAPGELTRRIDGRSFRMDGLGPRRRRVLAAVLDAPGVRDGVIQGEAVRLVVAEGADLAPLHALAANEGGTLESVPGRFEDAFIDSLGGGPGGTSPLTARMEDVTLDLPVTVECTNLTRRFGAFVATDDVSFAVRKGEIFGLLGPNGAGKSTTFKMLCGLLKPSSGTARVVGYDLRRAPSQAKLHLGYMAQKFSLYGLLTVKQNLDFFSGVYDLDGALRRHRIDEMIDTFELGRMLNVSPDTLPLGYKQRLALACALMHRPPVLFLDEPTSGVDPLTRREFWTHINALVRKGVTVVVTTHFMDEAEYCDRVALMYHGRLIALDAPDALKRTAVRPDLPDPTMEDAFVGLVAAADAVEAARPAPAGRVA